MRYKITGVWNSYRIGYFDETSSFEINSNGYLTDIASMDRFTYTWNSNFTGNMS